MTVALLAIVATWLVVLTVAVVLVVRQMAGIQVAVAQRPEGTPFSVDADGPAVGTAVPEAVATEFERAGIGPHSRRIVLLLFSATCGTCEDTLNGVDRGLVDTAGVVTVALVPGENARARELARTAAEKLDRVISGEAASKIAGAFEIHSVPFALGIEAGQVVSKAYVRAVSDIYELIREVGSAATGSPAGSHREAALAEGS